MDKASSQWQSAAHIPSEHPWDLLKLERRGDFVIRSSLDVLFYLKILTTEALLDRLDIEGCYRTPYP